MGRLARIAVATILLALPAAAAPAACLRLGAEEAAVEGRIAYESFPDAAGQTVSGLFLDLAAPACLTGAKDPQQDHRDIRRIQLFATDIDVLNELVRLVGHARRLRGSVFLARTPLQGAPILMDVSRIDMP